MKNLSENDRKCLQTIIILLSTKNKKEKERITKNFFKKIQYNE